MSTKISRRGFIGTTAVAGSLAMAETNAQVPHRPLGHSGIQVSALGVGGFHLGTIQDEKQGEQFVNEALDAGINFFDNALEYHDGQSETITGRLLKGKRDRVVLMTKVCTHGRDKKLAMQMLEESLRRLQTDHLDVWQIHEVIYYNDPNLIFRPGGAAEALLQAKQQGKVRLIGFTGHKDPHIHLKMLSHDFPFDTVQMPLNPFDASFRSFQQHVLPEAQRRGIAVLGMKSMGGSGEMVRKGAVTPQQALRYAMSLPVAVTISGMDSVEVLRQNLAVACGFQPMQAAEMEQVRAQCRMYAADGRVELFKTTVKYDGKVGREQHGMQSEQELPM